MLPRMGRSADGAHSRQNGRVSTESDERAPSGVFRICFVCTGNICRSPMAEAVMRHLIHERGYEGIVSVDSAGTGEWHVGESADPRTIDALARRGYTFDHHRARQFDPAWFSTHDLVIGFDRGHERILRSWAPTDDARASVQVITDVDPEGAGLDVPDPYYSDPDIFDYVLGVIERSCRALLDQLEPALRQGAR
jgi:protein-tyrosine phosphatase